MTTLADLKCKNPIIIAFLVGIYIKACFTFTSDSDLTTPIWVIYHLKETIW